MADAARWPDYPFESRWFVHRDGLRQHYVDEGDGEVVLMLHGNPTWSYYYRHLVLALRATHRCVAPDHIGMGWSDKPEDSRYEYSLRRRVDDLDAFIAGVVGEGAPITLVVHDWGGMIGLAWAVRNPGRIARIVLLNTAGFPIPAGKRLPWTLKLGRDSVLGQFLILHLNAFAGGATRLAVVKPMSPAERRAYVAPYDTPENRLATLRFVQDIPLGPDDRGHDIVRDTAAGLSRLAALPVLICWGLRDFVFDASFLREFERAFPAAEVHAWDDAGHYVLEDARERVVANVAKFLGVVPAGA